MALQQYSLDCFINITIELGKLTPNDQPFHAKLPYFENWVRIDWFVFPTRRQLVKSVFMVDLVFHM